MLILFKDICLYSLLVHLTGVAIVPNHWSPPHVSHTMMEVANYFCQNDQYVFRTLPTNERFL